VRGKVDGEARLRYSWSTTDYSNRYQSVSLLKQVDDKESIAMRRRMAGWNPNFLAKVLGIPTT
jgi:hypothetical protein